MTRSALHYISFFMNLQLHIKLFHWMTGSYAKHKATDELFESLSKSIDNFMETYIGRYGKPKFGSGKHKLDYTILSDAQIASYLRAQLAMIEKFELEAGDLQNIRDEMIQAMTQALYLCDLE